jgi:DNA-directed RNA polymerase specialized sigma24 family protein
MLRESGNPDERFSAFVRSRGEHHLRTATLIAGDWQAGEDLLQASLLKLYRAWPRLDTSADPDAYLRRITVNTRLSWWRARWRREAPAGASLAPPPAGSGTGEGPFSRVSSPGAGMAYSSVDDFAERRVVGLLVRPALAKLPRQQRAVLVLRYCDEVAACWAARPARSRRTPTGACARCASRSAVSSPCLA